MNKTRLTPKQIAQHNERITVYRKKCTDNLRAVFHLAHKDRASIREGLTALGFLNIPGLASKLFHGKALTGTQFYRIST